MRRPTAGWRVAAVAGAIAWHAVAVGADLWSLDLRTGLRLEDGGDVRVDDHDGGRHGARMATQLAPSVRWWRSDGRWTALAGLSSAAQLPARRADESLSRATASAGLRLDAGRTRWSADAEIGRVAFAAPSHWADRRRLTGRAGATRQVAADASVTASYSFDASWYGEAAAARPGRLDARHRLRAGVLWQPASGWWTTASLAGARSGSDRPAYRYGTVQGLVAAGYRRGPASASLQASTERRRYASDDEPWRLTWVGARVAVRLRPWLSVYGNVQRQHGHADGERLFEPWLLVDSGLHLQLPLTRPAVSRSLTARSAARRLEPQSEAAGWRFRYRARGARSVHLIGSFTDWDPHPMQRGPGPDEWETTVVLPPGVYEYAFVVDGQQWRVPPAAPHYVDDGFGRQNGVLVVDADNAGNPAGGSR